MKLPSEFESRTLEWMGEDTYRALESALQAEPPVSIRVNRAKCGKELSGEPVPWASSGIYLPRRPSFTFDPLFHAGCYYVQEASSMFVEQVLRTYVTAPVVMLDLCAAPGGKSTHARSLLPEGSLLVANEVMRNRSQVLAENLIKWGDSGVVVTNNDPADFTSLTALFDVVLTDVPCSGEGMFRKDPVAVDEWSVDNVLLCRQRQRRILADVWPALKPGGLLIYSTCTYNKEEDEENVAWIAGELGAEVLKVDVRPEWSITGNMARQDFPVYRFLPHQTKGEGFFLAALRKHETGCDGGTSIGCDDKMKEKRQKGNDVRAVSVPDGVKDWLRQAETFLFETKDSKVTAFPRVRAAEYALLRRSLKILHAGVTLGELKGKNLIPDHSLAMSTLLNKDMFPCAELTYEQAVAYLRKEAVTLDTSVPRGYVLLTFQGVPLGFAKNIGNRANNLYPQEWRIRSGYLPEERSFVW
ncbi:rRNA cytosine-C5-methyltransferase [Phocaeicola sp.]|uniref:methyltransferase RsmF C-terminal domain-like protein n=1 Tax=Phocaeicola sp. TaxID=2773926 RepID=UPI0023D1BCB9|nr:rRNA cytosine-C5-methyltransferase [Phocaeicola sp.]MDE5677814.1 RsmB/NOP family class I SAM-dependent RNA methyltransferase [Phocaeicola sp.]